MSIFKDTFKKDIQDQLKVRQDAIHSRTPDAIQYFNARNSWIRMSSSVNVHGTNELAKKYGIDSDGIKKEILNLVKTINNEIK